MEGRSGSLRMFLRQSATYGIVKAGVFQQSGVPMVRSGDIRGGRIGGGLPLVSRKKSDEYARTVLQEGDVLVALVGYPGESAVVPRELEGANISRAVGLLRLSRDLLPEYLSHYLNSPVGRSEFLRPSAGSAQIVVNLADLNRMEITVPSMSAQLAISATLSDADNDVAALGRLIAKKRAIKQGMMQELLTGRTRLPGFARDWRQLRLSELLAYEQPGRYLVSSTDYVAGGTPVLTAGKTFVLGYTQETSGIYEALPVVIFDDFTTDSKYVTFPFKAKSSAMKMLTPRPGVDLRFAFERMRLIDFVAVDHKRRWITEYGKIEIVVPPLDEQRAIAQVAEDADMEIDTLERRLEKARAVKQGMMQELLTGRTHLPVAEALS